MVLKAAAKDEESLKKVLDEIVKARYKD